jgi:hypothetical protein
MGQADFFGNLEGAQKKLDAARKAGIISAQQEEEHINSMLSMYDAINEKKAIGREWDLKTQSVYQNLKRFGKEMAEDAQNLKKAKKSLKKTEDDIVNMGKVADELTRRGNKEAAALVKKKKEQLQVEKEIEEVNYQTAKSSVSKMGQALNMFGKVGGFLSSNFGGLASIFSGILGTVFNIGMGLLKIIFPIEKAFKLFLEMQKVVGALSADIGMTAIEYRNLLNMMPTIYNEILGYGGKIEDIGKIIKGFSDETGKNRIFSAEEITDIVKLGNNTGLAVEGATKMVAEFDNLGYSLSTTLKVAQKGRNEAARFNINQTKLLQTTTEVVKALTGSGFGRSVEGLTKLAAKAESLRFNLGESIKSFKDAFFSPEKAVEAAAKIQVLGGEFAQMFGDPFQLMYDSMNNADGMAEKLINSAKSLAIKNKNGDFIIPPAQRQILKETAEALGQNYDQIVNAGIEQARTADKMNTLSKSAGSLIGITDDDQQALANLMTINKKGQYEIKMPNGVSELVSNITSQDQLKNILSQRKANEDAAKQRLTLQERLNNVLDRFAIGLTPLFTKLDELLSNSGFLQKVEELGKTIASQLIPMITDLFNADSPLRKGLDMFLKGFTDFLGEIKAIMGNEKTPFWDRISEVFGKIGGFFMDGVMPFIKIAFAEIFKALQGLPFGVGDAMLSAALQLEEGDAKTKAISQKMGIDNQKLIDKKISNVAQNALYMGPGDSAIGVGSGLLNVIGGAAESVIGLIPAAFGNSDYLTAGIARTGIGGARTIDALASLQTGGIGVGSLESSIIDNAVKGQGIGNNGAWARDVYDMEYLPTQNVQDYVKFSDGTEWSGGAGQGMAMISELNANRYANSNTNGGDQTITVVINGEIEAKTKNGIQKINAKDFYDSDPVAMGEWMKRTMSQTNNGSANYIVDFGVAPLA